MFENICFSRLPQWKDEEFLYQFKLVLKLVKSDVVFDSNLNLQTSVK